MLVYHTVNVADFVAAAIQNKCYSFDIEHPPELSIHQDDFRLAGVSFATGAGDKADTAFYETRLPEIEYIVRTLFAQPDLEAIAFNGKYDLQGLVRAKIITPYQYPEQYVDPMVATNLLDDNRRPKELGLKIIMREGFGVEMMDFLTAWAFGENSREFSDYGTDDARQEFFLWKFLKPKLIAESLWPLFMKILNPSSKLFADMEQEGIGWDIPKARELLRKFQILRDTLKEEIYTEIGALNLNSGDQVAKRIFEELGYDAKDVPLTKSGKRLSVDADTMDMLAGRYPICDKIRTYRTCDKMIGTYIEPITRMALADKRSRVHSTYWLVSSTGRTRNEKPNFQNIPAWLHKRPGFEELNIRKCVIAAPGRKLIVSDLSQIELRICGHITQDPLFLKAYLDWKCTACKQSGSSVEILHKCPKCGTRENESILKDLALSGFWHGLDLHQMTTDGIPALGGNRQNGKITNFSFIYLASARKMNMEYPDLSIRLWQQAIDQFFELYKGVRMWHIRMESAMKSTRVCTDIFGRKRRITAVEIAKSYKHALNMFVNFPVQASACNLIQLAMAKLRAKWIASGEWLKTIFPSNFVHDETVYEAVESEADKFAAEIQWEIEHAVTLRVPVRTDPKIVNAWGEIKA